MAVNEIFQVALEGRFHGQTIINTFHYKHDTDGGGNAQALLGGAFELNVIPAIKGVVSSAYSVTRLITQKIYPSPPTVPTIGTGAAGAGSVAGVAHASSVAVTVTKRTAFAGRKYRGRVYLVGVPEASTLSSELTNAAFIAWTAVAAAMESAIVNGGNSWKPVLWHRASKTNDEITRCDVQLVLRNQRRRQSRKGV